MIGIFSGISFFRLAKDWPEVIDAFAKIELIIESEAYKHCKGWSLKKKIRLSSIVFLLLALSEHVIGWISFFYDRFKQIEICEWEIDSMFYYLTTTHLSYIFDIFPVKLVTVLWGEYMNETLTFAWNFIVKNFVWIFYLILNVAEFQDLFIIIVSLGVSSSFAKINQRLKIFRGRVRCQSQIFKILK